MSNIQELKELVEMNPMDLLGRECVGCDTKVGLTQCDGTMCRKCWEAENDTLADFNE
jgi:hypothetical protein